MATFGGNTVEAAGGTGGPVFVFDTITALSALCSATKVVFGNDGEITAAWSFNTGPLDDGTPRVTLATDDPAVAALEAIEDYLDTEVAAILTAVELIDNVVETDRFAVNLIAGVVGVSAGAGATDTGTQRVRLASDDTAIGQLGQIANNTNNASVSLGIIDQWDETDRAKVNIVVGQAGVSAGAGPVAANTPRVTHASDDPAVALLTTIDADTSGILVAAQIMDDWDESDRAKVNIIVGQAGITGGAGAVALNTPRVTHASDDPAVTALQIIDDWDETDRAKVNIVAGQTGISAAAGAVAANTPRMTLASDDPAVAHLATIVTNTTGTGTSLAILDDWDESDRAKVNPIAGQAGVQGGAGTITALTQRVTIATDDESNNFLGTIAAGVVNQDSALAAGAFGYVQLVQARNTEPTAVGTTGDAAFVLATMLGKQVVMPYAIPASTWQYASVSGGVTDTADDVAKAAAGVGVRNYITHASVVNGHATVSTEVVIKDGSTVIWRGWAQAGGGGVSERFDPPLRGTANTAVNVTNITTGSATYFNLQGFVAAE